MENTGDDILSMVDVLEEDNAREEEANAVLGASDDQNCTYSQGYLDRQALYSCLTCIVDETTSAGVCFACSLHCHDGHELVELYTKRNFRCDCGNSKFKSFACKLFSEKDETNARNSYNHNFQGKYCTCDRPYPDPEDDVEDEMIQCVVCEDWFHSRHLGTLAPVEYQEMVCDSCMCNVDFLRWYKSLSVPSQEMLSGKSLLKNQKSKEVPKVAEQEEKEVAEQEEKEVVEQEDKVIEEKPKTDTNEKKSTNDCDSSEVTQGEGSGQRLTKSSEASSSNCKLESLKTGNKDSVDTSVALKATFWQNNWRSSLCRCKECKQLYKTNGVAFLAIDDDTVYEYEQRGKKRQHDNSSYDRGMRALGSMDRINQVEVLTEYNDMKSQLNDYLKAFAGEGKVVTKEDIEKFFEGMRARKRQKLEERTGFQFFCK